MEEVFIDVFYSVWILFAHLCMLYHYLLRLFYVAFHHKQSAGPVHKMLFKLFVVIENTFSFFGYPVLFYKLGDRKSVV